MVKRLTKKDKKIFWTFAILLVAIFSATAFLFLNPICLLSLFNFCWYFLIEFKTLLIIYIFW